MMIIAVFIPMRSYSAPPIQFDRLEDAQQMITDYSCLHEMIDSVVDHLCTVYPELHPGDDEKKIILKREITYFWTETDKEKAKVIAGFPPKYKYLSVAIKKFNEIGRRVRPATEDEEEFRQDNEQWYIGFKLCLAPTINHLERKKAMYKRSGMSKREIQKDIGKRILELIDEFHATDPNVRVIEECRERTRAQYGL